jgi:hypothetical protein
MGLIDRAFGVDKNSALVDRLAFHWEMVASHYENHLKKNEVSEEQEKVLREIQSLAKRMSNKVSEAKKGFGVVNFDSQQISVLAGELAALGNQITVITEKPRWLSQAVVATLDIVNGKKRLYQQHQLWFVD